MCKHDATIIEKKRITVDLKNVGKLVSEAKQFSKVKKILNTKLHPSFEFLSNISKEIFSVGISL